MAKTAPPIRMWAAVVRTNRGTEWINWLTVQRTRKQARAAYLSNLDERHHERFLKAVRFARVVVSIEGTQQ